MVDRFPGPGEEGPREAESTPRQESVFSKHLRKLGIFGERRTETAEDDLTEEKPKKFRKFFKGLFRNVVEPPERLSEQPHTEEVRRPSLESLFFAWHDHEDHPEVMESAETAKVEKAEPTTPFTPNKGETSRIAPVLAEESNAPREEAYKPLTPAEAHEVAREHSTSEPIVEAPNERPVVRPMAPELNDRIPQPVNDRVVFERPRESIEEKEVVIERGPGMVLPVALVGAEYFARKRADKKLERAFTNKTESLEQNAKQDRLVRTQLETIVKQNREQLESLKRERGIAAPEGSQTVRTAEAQKPVEKKVERPMPARTPEVKRPAAATPERSKEVVAQPERVDSYKIMEQVADAAEHDVPVERVFERSHEVKDDKSIPITAASVGAIMAAQAEEQRKIAKLQALQRQMGDPSQGLPIAPHATASRGMYKQAVLSGFVGAVLIIVFGLLAFLLQ